jgi:hypothetical protein
VFSFLKENCRQRTNPIYSLTLSTIFSPYGRLPADRDFSIGTSLRLATPRAHEFLRTSSFASRIVVPPAAEWRVHQLFAVALSLARIGRRIFERALAFGWGECVLSVPVATNSSDPRRKFES